MLSRLLSWFLPVATVVPVAAAPVFTVVTHQGVKFTVCQVDLKTDRLELFLKDDKGQPLKSFAALENYTQKLGRKLTFAMNAGMYHGDFSPVGWCVAGGEELAPLNLQSGEGNFFLKPNGVFCITDRGPAVLESSAAQGLQGKVLLATQSGPLLVNKGVIHPAFRLGSPNKLHRNGVGVTAAGAVVFAISEGPVNFHDFATLFRDQLHCPDALFLDGTVCSLYAPALRRKDKRMDIGPMLGITVDQADK